MSDQLRTPIKVTSDINYGQILQAIVVGGGIAFWAITKGNTADDAKGEIASLRADMTQQIIELKRTITDGQQQVSLQIAGLPDQRAQLNEVMHRTDGEDQKIVSIEVQLAAVETKIAKVTADIDGLIRSSAAGPHR